MLVVDATVLDSELVLKGDDIDGTDSDGTLSLEDALTSH
jgi:hypothetical protein